MILHLHWLYADTASLNLGTNDWLIGCTGKLPVQSICKDVPVKSHQPEVAEELSLEGFGEEQVARAGVKPRNPGSGLAGAAWLVNT